MPSHNGGTQASDFIAPLASVGSGIMAGKRAKAARAWQRRRYAERYQVTMKDMEKAGINPILAVQGALGGAGSMPGASQGAQFPDIGKTINTGREVSLKRERFSRRELALMESQRYKNTSEGTTAIEMGERIKAERHLLELKFPGAEYEAAMDRHWYGKFFRGVGRALPTVTSAAGVVGAMKLGKLVNPMVRGTRGRRSGQGASTNRGVPSAKERGFDFEARAKAWRKRNAERGSK